LKNFELFEKYLEQNKSDEQEEFFKNFANYFISVQNYQAYKDQFDNSHVFTLLIRLISFSKPPSLVTLFTIVMIYSRSGKFFLFSFPFLFLF